MPSAVHSYVDTRRERFIYARLKAPLLALETLAVRQRMAAAQSEIERGRERLWLGADAAGNCELRSGDRIEEASKATKDFATR